MSHPDRPSRGGGGSAGALAEPATPASLAAFAEQHGLATSTARPPLTVYIQQLWQRRHFIWTFASSKSVSMYSKSRLGQLWQILTPLLNAAVYYLIFGVLVGTSRGVENYIAFLVTGVFIFTFTQRSVMTGARSVGGNLSLIRALHFPRASLPFAFTIVELQQLLVSLVVLFAIIIATSEPVTWHWLLLIPTLMTQILFNIGLCLIVARIGAFVRDIQQLLPFIMRTWFYASGIIFAIQPMAQTFAKKHRDFDWVGTAMEYNPAACYVDLSRLALMDSYRKDYYHDFGHVSSLHLWWAGLAWAVGVFLVGFWYFYRAEERYGRG